MTPERWDYLKHLKPSPGRYLHVSKPLMDVPIMVPTGEYDDEGNEIEKEIGKRTIVAPFKGKTFKKPKTLEDAMYAGLSKRQKRKARKGLYGR